MQLFIVDLNTYSAPLRVNKRHSSKIEQLSVTIGIARKQSYYLSLAESTSYGGL